MSKQRFRKERLATIIAAAATVPGARVRVSAVTGDAVIDFAGAGEEGPSPPAPADEGERIEEMMNERMGAA
jgi:hypothetical protein